MRPRLGVTLTRPCGETRTAAGKLCIPRIPSPEDPGYVPPGYVRGIAPEVPGIGAEDREPMVAAVGSAVRGEAPSCEASGTEFRLKVPGLVGSDDNMPLGERWYLGNAPLHVDLNSGTPEKFLKFFGERIFDMDFDRGRAIGRTGCVMSLGSKFRSSISISAGLPFLPGYPLGSIFGTSVALDRELFVCFRSPALALRLCFRYSSPGTLFESRMGILRTLGKANCCV
jgi:hypothetical protein